MVRIKKKELLELLDDQLKLRKIVLLFGSQINEAELLVTIVKILGIG